jgi:ElaB/YqjD/DUF883 family membrane-anchored ribosome-binding protein
MARIHGNGGEMASRFENGARELGDKIGDTMESTFATVKDKVGEVGGKVGSFVKEHPVASLAAGVGIGLLFARMLTRR